jgi:hypothetical protein
VVVLEQMNTAMGIQHTHCTLPIHTLHPPHTHTCITVFFVHPTTPRKKSHRLTFGCEKDAARGADGRLNMLAAGAEGGGGGRGRDTYSGYSGYRTLDSPEGGRGLMVEAMVEIQVQRVGVCGEEGPSADSDKTAVSN